MRIAITADIHLGSSYNLGRINPQSGFNTRLEDFLKSFDTMVDYVLDSDNDIDLLVIAGDIYKTRQPTTTQQREFAKRVARLVEGGKDTIILTGNHDILVSENAAHTIAVIKELGPRHVTIVDEPELVEVDGVKIGLIPYIYRQRLNVKTNSEALDYYKETVAEMLEAECKILIGHQTVEGIAMPSGYTNLDTLNELVVPRSILSGFDFCLFGHIHEYQVVNKQSPLVVSPGPIERINFSEADKPRGFVVYDTDKKKHELIELEVSDLYRIELDLTEEDDPTKVVLEAIDVNRIVNSIVVLNLKINETDVSQLNQREIQKVLDTARFSAGIRLEIVKVRTSRNSDITERVSALDALKKYVESREDLKDIKEGLFRKGAEIIRVCDNQRNRS